MNSRFHSVGGLLTLVVLTNFSSVPSHGQSSRPLPGLLESARPLVIAHRGYSAVAPENTLPAFERALAAGADLVELDYHHSRDGQMVVIHDGTLDRTTDATNRWGGRDLRVVDRTLPELRSLQAGGWFQPAFPGIHLPTLSEALNTIQQGGITLIERKAGDAAACVRLLQEKDLINRVVVQSFDWDYLRDFRRLEANQVLGALGPPGSREGRKLTDAEKKLSAQWIDEVGTVGAQIVVWNRQVDAAAVEVAHARGLKVWVYTINEPEVATRLLAAGVDGIITDNPAVIWKTIALRSAAPRP